jgi:hypothetical protein
VTDFCRAGVTIAATWDRALFYQRGLDMGTEHKLKGVDVQLGPVVGPLGRAPEAGRNWEGFSPDPVLAGIAVGETVKGIQAAGVMAWVRTSGLIFLHHCADANVVGSMSRIFLRERIPSGFFFSYSFLELILSLPILRLTSKSTKHYILNEQEHFRQGAPPANLTASISANLDDVTMHEVGATDPYIRFATLTILTVVSVALRRCCQSWHSFHHVQL